MKLDAALPADTLVRQLRMRTTYLTCTEVMHLLGKSRNAMCRWVRKGVIPGFRFGKDYRFDPVVLAHWIEAHAM